MDARSRCGAWASATLTTALAVAPMVVRDAVGRRLNGPRSALPAGEPRQSRPRRPVQAVVRPSRSRPTRSGTRLPAHVPDLAVQRATLPRPRNGRKRKVGRTSVANARKRIIAYEGSVQRRTPPPCFVVRRRDWGLILTLCWNAWSDVRGSVKSVAGSRCQVSGCPSTTIIPLAPFEVCSADSATVPSAYLGKTCRGWRPRRPTCPQPHKAEGLAVGYGSTCARNQGWPYPTKAELRLTASKLVAVG